MIKFCWDKYKVIEKDFIDASKYVTFNEANYDTVSEFFDNEIVLLGSEIEKTVKFIAKKASEKKPGNISEYKEVLLKTFPNIKSYIILFMGTNISIKPFGDWEEEKKLFWWDIYGDVKHGLNSENSKPTMKIALYMLGAYYLLLRLSHYVQFYPNDVEYSPYEWSRLIDWDDEENKMHNIYESFTNIYKK